MGSQLPIMNTQGLAQFSWARLVVHSFTVPLNMLGPLRLASFASANPHATASLVVGFSVFSSACIRPSFR